MGRWGVVAAAALVVAAVFGLLAVTESLTAPTGGADFRPFILGVSLIGLNVVSYAVWLNRWNIVAHTQLAFSIVAYAVPIWWLRSLDGISSEALDVYYQVVAAGFFFALLGTVLGGWFAAGFNTDRLRERAGFDRPEVQAVVSRRVLRLVMVAVAAVVVAFVVMRFVPAFTADPLTAKFFRGPYAAPYQPVAPLYRAGTTIIAILLPVVFVLAFKRRRLSWLLAGVAAVGVMLAGLMREPAVSGLLLVLGVWWAVRRRAWLPYFMLLVGSYFLGGALYYVLAVLGVGNFSGLPAGSSLVEQAAAGAPDIKDQIQFMSAWLMRPEYTNGMTWVGGLIPGNNPWNPSVWSLLVVNPGQDITQLASGGLRLPAPIWGLVSFGWPGVVLVSFVHGVVIGYLAGVARRVLPSRSVEVSTYWLVAYVALVDVLPVFFRLSYLSVLQVVLVVAVLFWRTGVPRGSRLASAGRGPAIRV